MNEHVIQVVAGRYNGGNSVIILTNLGNLYAKDAIDSGKWHPIKLPDLQKTPSFAQGLKPVV